MKGAHRIIVESKKVKYDFTVKRNITIISGDSATGKTVLIDLIREYRRYGADSGVHVSCDCPCRTLDAEDWATQLMNIEKSIIFIDEGNRFLVTQQFAKLVQKSDNYFVIATRERLPMLPYSINEIYGFRQSGKFANAKQKYNEIFQLYGEISADTGVTPHLVITEDANSGFDFFSELSKQQGRVCVSASGKSNIISTMEKYKSENNTILVVVDGAAFGSEMCDTYEYICQNNHYVLYAPESFEWLILSSGVVEDSDIENILSSPQDFIESKDYFSWERFFTDLLSKKTCSDNIWKYSKKKLNKVYLSSKVMQAVKRVMRMINWENKD